MSTLRTKFTFFCLFVMIFRRMFTQAFYVKMGNVLKALAPTMFHLTVWLHGKMILMLGIRMITETHVFFYDLLTLKTLNIYPFYCYRPQTVPFFE